jgi:hypothetical protein
MIAFNAKDDRIRDRMIARFRNIFRGFIAEDSLWPILVWRSHKKAI